MCVVCVCVFVCLCLCVCVYLWMDGWVDWGVRACVRVMERDRGIRSYSSHHSKFNILFVLHVASWSVGSGIGSGIGFWSKGDHGMFNSWDRQPVIHDSDAADTGVAAETLQLSPHFHQLRQNFVMNRNWLGTTRSGYCVDYDDGSSQYNATGTHGCGCGLYWMPAKHAIPAFICSRSNIYE